MTNILIIDDNADLCRALTRRLTRDTDYSVESAYSLKDGMDKANARKYDVVFLDVMMPDGNGLNELPAIKKTPSSPEIIIITGKGESAGAAMAIEHGAWDYVQKGASLEALVLPLERALQYRKEKQKSSAATSLKRDNIIGNSASIKACLDIVAKAAATDSNVLIVGETGTGKELFAQAIHENSKRREKNLVVLDCAGIPEKLLESMLFGHEKGAFTGADKARGGLIKEAFGGTLFLDEVGELSSTFQRAFLRVLQEGTYRPIGSDKELKSDFRLVSATNRDLDTLVQQGDFRQDLLFRLNTITIKIPPIRERTDDIKTIAIHYITKICEKLRMGNKGFSTDFMEALIGYEWPGNVRELAHVLESAIAMAGGESTLVPQFLPPNIRLKLVQKSILPANDPVTNDSRSEDLKSYKTFRQSGLNTLEKQYLTKLMLSVGGDVTQAMKISGLSRSQLYKLLKKHNIEV